ncbi:MULTISPECIES: hypothetical protein [unclassified Sulfurospirillum]|uniref:hypothetical protein n=1 Tax=unclassified Sulfurospirillum TaxID=2618290 RepID=UPI00050882A0|nr:MULTISPECIES: hypothetical protein [unclassified Sulfurospirillum]KFL34161.1 hypothetical protein JU57_07555 [Sulfurospirillum sp. SCADC]
MLKVVSIVVGLVVALVLGNAIYAQLTKSGSRSMNLSCQKEVVVFERVYFQEQIHALKEATHLKGVELKLQIQKARYAPSKLFETLDLEEVKHILTKEFGEASSQNVPRLDLLIYENDPLDPGKKTKEAKLYAGYLVFGFYMGEALIYKIQIDFMDKEGKDIAKRIACAKASLMALQDMVIKSGA